MAFDITKKRALETAQIELQAGDGSPLVDDEGNQLYVTVHGPASKIWQQADAEMSRKRAERIRKGGGKIEAALDHGLADRIDFLCRITVSFDGWVYPNPDGKNWPTLQHMFRAAYSDDALGYIRDHTYAEAANWESFCRGSATS